MGFIVFKQRTAYEMRISDWSSDVCSSDLVGADHARHRADNGTDPDWPRRPAPEPAAQAGARALVRRRRMGPAARCRKRAAWRGQRSGELGRASCRERVCQYVLNSVVAVSLKKKSQTCNI